VASPQLPPLSLPSKRVRFTAYQKLKITEVSMLSRYKRYWERMFTLPLSQGITFYCGRETHLSQLHEFSKCFDKDFSSTCIKFSLGLISLTHFPNI
jgi:hypothetical protein